MKAQFYFQVSFVAVVLIARITAIASQMLQHNEGTSRWVVCVGVGVVLFAGESSISCEVDDGVFTLVVSPKIRLDKYQPRYLKEYVEQTRLQISQSSLIREYSKSG